MSVKDAASSGLDPRCMCMPPCGKCCITNLLKSLPDDYPRRIAMNDDIKDGWFSERELSQYGLRLSLPVKDVLYKDNSEYQEILIFETRHHGRVLVLDGIIQCTEYDEFSYQEMISFVPLCAHPNPSKVLIVGGGDGGVAREVVKHPLVKEVVQVEIDQKVVDACKQHLPHMSHGLDNPKVTLHVGDGFEFMRSHRDEFDVIITDSSDPIGPAVNLFREPYFEMLHAALRPGGIVCSQGGTVWENVREVRQTMDHCRQHFPVVKYSYTSVPTYPTGQIGFVVGCADAEADPAVPKLTFTEEELVEMDLKYYNSQIHAASFVLPNFIRRELYS